MKQSITTDSGLAEMAARITRFTTADGIHPTAIAGMEFIRGSIAGEPVHSVYLPSLCVIAQGAKQAMLGNEVYLYDRSRYLVASVDLPITGTIIEATPAQPYLCFKLDLDPREIASLLLDAELPAASGTGPARGLFVSRLSREMIDAVLRLVRLLDAPEDIPALAPLARREILYRLLKSEEGYRLRQMATAHSQAKRIAKAIEWLKSHYVEPLRIEHVASEANMSASSLHHHFKAITAMSPLQYQKQLRLQEARRLLLSEAVDAATAGHRVGYESPSQFSREYSRLFGAPPGRDLRHLRQFQGQSAAS